MRLSELDPKLEGSLRSGMLRFNCPLGHAHKIRVPVGAYGTQQAWTATGEFPDSLSLTPSILAHTGVPFLGDSAGTGDYQRAAECGWHGFVTNGAIVTVP